MRSIDSVLEALDDVVEALAAVDLDVLTPPDRLVVVERLENARRRQVAVSHAVVARLEQFDGCPPVPITLADVLRVSPREAKRRIRDAKQLAPRRALTGEPLPPVLPETSVAWEAGELDGEHLRVIQKFFRELPTMCQRWRWRKPNAPWRIRRRRCGPTSWRELLTGWLCI